MTLHSLKCPYCEKQAAALSTTIFAFLSRRPDKCQYCLGPIKFNSSYFPFCFLIYLVLALLCKYYLFSFLDSLFLADYGIYRLFLFILAAYISFELPAKYFGFKTFQRN